MLPFYDNLCVVVRTHVYADVDKDGNRFNFDDTDKDRNYFLQRNLPWIRDHVPQKYEVNAINIVDGLCPSDPFHLLEPISTNETTNNGNEFGKNFDQFSLSASPKPPQNRKSQGRPLFL